MRKLKITYKIHTMVTSQREQKKKEENTNQNIRSRGARNTTSIQLLTAFQTYRMAAFNFSGRNLWMVSSINTLPVSKIWKHGSW